MEVLSLKSDLRKVIDLNPQPISFEIICNGLETYATKRGFGQRIMELLNDDRVSEICLTTVARKGFYGNSVNGFKYIFNNNLTDISSLTFRVTTHAQKRDHLNYLNSRSMMERAIAEFGTSA